MRSQKQSNRTPRPFKFNGSERAWSGGKRKDAPASFSKPSLKTSKPTGVVSPTPPASLPDDTAGESATKSG